jgi:hypothetical protein
MQTGLTGTPTITGVSGSGATYTVSASTGTGTTSATGTLKLRVPNAGTIKDLAGNTLAGPFPVDGPPYTIDKTAPPTPSIIIPKPANPTNQTTATLNFTDSESPVSYLCRLDGGAFSSCTSPKSYSGLPDGTHTFYVEAKDTAGNVSSPTSYGWIVDTDHPPAPTITNHPTDPTTSSSATFTFTDGEAGATFECRLDSASFGPCPSPTTYASLSVGEHNFYVRAVDAAGNRSGSTQFEWDITQTTGMPFTISGNAPNKLYPGAAAQQLLVKLTNPNNVPIYVTSLTATVSATGLPALCGTSNFSIVQATIAPAGVQVPANNSTTLPATNGTAPTIQMPDTHVSQDACQGATVTINYTGSAHS